MTGAVDKQLLQMQATGKSVLMRFAHRGFVTRGIFKQPWFHDTLSHLCVSLCVYLSYQKGNKIFKANSMSLSFLYIMMLSIKLYIAYAIHIFCTGLRLFDNQSQMLIMICDSHIYEIKLKF